MISQPMYRAHIIEQPEWEEYLAFDHRGDPGFEQELWRKPVGWEASPDYIERFGSNKFFEPDTNKWFKSRSSAASRTTLLNGMGYVAIVQRSAPVVWPKHGEKSVDASEVRQVTQAIRVLKRSGLLDSADSLLG